MKSDSKEKMQTCPFEPTHKIPSASLYKHIQTCKSINKMNFQQCKFNPNHWINFAKIKQHEEICQQQFHIKDSIDDSAILQLVNAMEVNNSYSDIVFESQYQHQGTNWSQSSGRNKRMKKNKKNMERQEEEIKPKKWEQPDFGVWLEKNYEKKPNNFDLSEIDFDDSSDCSHLNLRQM